MVNPPERCRVYGSYSMPSDRVRYPNLTLIHSILNSTATLPVHSGVMAANTLNFLTIKFKKIHTLNHSSF